MIESIAPVVMICCVDIHIYVKNVLIYINKEEQTFFDGHTIQIPKQFDRNNLEIGMQAHQTPQDTSNYL